MKLYRSIYFSPDFDFKKHQEIRGNFEKNETRENYQLIKCFDIDFDFSGNGELCFSFIAKNEDELAFMIDLDSRQSIELYHFLKKEIEEVKTLMDLESIL